MNLRQLNPSNSLFGRIFIWFWLATLVMLGSGVLLARLLVSNVSLWATLSSVGLTPHLELVLTQFKVIVEGQIS